MNNYLTEEKDFVKVEINDEVQVSVVEGMEDINGTVVENNIQEKYLRLNSKPVDVIIKYSQIAYIEVFDFVKFDIAEVNKKREKEGLEKLKLVSTSEKQIENLNDFCVSINHEGCLLSDLNKHEEAIEKYNLVLSLNPNYIPSLYNKGIAYHSLEKHSEAIQVFEEVIKLDPTHILSLHNKAIDLYLLGNFEESIKAFDEVLRIEPNHIHAINNKKEALNKLANE